MELESPGVPSPQCRFALAIDPGVHGALATYEWVDDDAAWKVDKLAGSPQELFWQCSKYKVTAEGLSAPPVAVIEDVGGFIGIPQPGSRMFTFGRSYGQLEGVLVSLGFRIHRVRPQKWQGELGVKSRKDESKPDHKRRMRKMALDLFPHLKPTLDTCDALLILWWYIHEKYLLTKSE